MKCPKCSHDMREIRQDDVYIDVCQRCRGVFLDAGELEMLLYDTHSHDYHEHKHDHRNDYRHEEKHYKEHKHYDHHDSHKHYHPHKKKSKMKSILGDLFDF